MKYIFFIPILIFLIFISSCTAHSNLTLLSNDAGVFSIQIKLHSIFVQYLNDFEEVAGNLVDSKAVETTLSAREDITDATMTREKNTIVLSFSFKDLFRIVDNERNSGIFLQKEPNGDRAVLMVFTKKSFISLLQQYLGVNSIVGYLVPDESMHKNEYYTQLAWAFEEYASKTEVYHMLDNFLIVLKVHLNGTLVVQKGGTRIDDTTVVFRLYPLNLLESDSVFSFRWQPASE